MNAPALIPVSTAQLPRTYEAAKRALSECSEVDECKDWADKAAALASYAPAMRGSFGSGGAVVYDP